MPLPDQQVFAALSSTSILTSMITPAVLISACGTLIFSTSARLARIFDRVQMLKGEVEAVMEGKLPFPEERMKMLKVQTRKQRVRAWLIQKAMAALYTATVLFVASSLAIALNVAYGTDATEWLPSGLALLVFTRAATTCASSSATSTSSRSWRIATKKGRRRGLRTGGPARPDFER